jgi:hypothetical protein
LVIIFNCFSLQNVYFPENLYKTKIEMSEKIKGDRSNRRSERKHHEQLQ